MPWWKKTEPIRLPGVQHLDGHEMAEYLKTYPTVLYRYRGNTVGFVVLGIMALLLSVMALYIWFDAPALDLRHWLLMAAMVGGALFLLGVVVYWVQFTRFHYLALSERHLLIGNGSRVLAIEWGHLDERSVDFLTSIEGETKGLLSLVIGNEEFPLRIFSRYAVLDNLHAFMSTFLTRVAGE